MAPNISCFDGKLNPSKVKAHSLSLPFRSCLYIRIWFPTEKACMQSRK